MIVILEGPSGSGKTALATEWQKRGALVYRAFRGPRDGHNPGANDPDLAAAQVPVNSWQEDVFAADLLLALARPFVNGNPPGPRGTADQYSGPLLKGTVVLDRSLPSALAYDIISPPSGVGPMGPERYAALIRVWAKRMRRAGAVIVFTHAHPSHLAGRSRFSVEHLALEQDLIGQFCRKSALPLFEMTTASPRCITPEQAFAEVSQRIEAYWRASVLRAPSEAAGDADA